MGKKVAIQGLAEHTGMSQHYLYTKARAGEIPFILSGSKRIFDVELVEEFLRKEALKNIKQEDNSIEYGKLRRIDI